MNNLTRARQGFYQDDNSRLGAGVAEINRRLFLLLLYYSSSSSSSSSSPTAASLQHPQIGLPLAYYYSYQQQHQPRGPTPSPSPMDFDPSGTLMRCCGGGGGGANNASQLHDHLMLISMDGSSPSPSTTASNNNISVAEHHDYSSDRPHPFMRSTPARGGGESSEGPSSGNAMVVPIEREHMFDKVVTPSDVGKLNRLVIPKQHAEKYFPLDSSTNEKGLLLNFEDRNGKPWRFRYSYWNSSQSYVMTKGWSRFVKEKKLDAGDIVSFQRGLGDLGKDRLFIDWRRRPDAPPPPLNPLHHHLHHHHHHPSIPTLSVPPPHHHHHHHQFSFHPWNHPFYLQNHHPPRDPYSHLLQLNSSINNTTQQYTLYESHQHHLLNSSRGGGYGYGSSVKTGNPCSGSIIYLDRSATAGAAERVGSVGMGMRMVQVQKGSGSSLIRGILHDKEDEDVDEPLVFESVPVVQGKAAAKRLRLFGVNMDCPISEECDDPDDQSDIISSTAVPRIMPGPSQSNYSSSSISPLQLNLRPYTAPHTTNATQMVLQTMPTDPLNKGKTSMSLELDM